MKEFNHDFVLLTGSSNPELAGKIGERLGVETHQVVSRFADGEARVDIPVNIRRREVFIIQPTTPPNVDGHYAELFAMIDASKRSSADHITAVIPYFGYSRQDRIDGRRTSVTAASMAKTVQARGAQQILTVDIHNEAADGYVDIPWDNLYASFPLTDAIKKVGLEDILVASPDRGGFERAVKYSELLGLGEDVAIVYKRRNPLKPNESKITSMVGDVEDREVLLVDDMLDTGGTMANAADYLMQRGARSVRAAVTHGLFSKDGLEKINNSAIQELFITDTISPREDVLKSPKIKIVSMASDIADAIECIYTGESISERYKVN